MFRGGRFAETLSRIEALKTEFGGDFPTLAEAAMRYVLSHDAVSVLIPGMKTPDEVDMNVACSDADRLPDELIERLTKHAWVRNFYK
jgi:aryl-alcohol dehydrogenase-like predicted oxidoreductase